MSKKEKPNSAPKPTVLEVIRMRKKAAKLRKAENRNRPGPRETEEESWHSE